jgi:hypothetical protein
MSGHLLQKQDLPYTSHNYQLRRFPPDSVLLERFPVGSMVTVCMSAFSEVVLATLGEIVMFVLTTISRLKTKVMVLFTATLIASSNGSVDVTAGTKAFEVVTQKQEQISTLQKLDERIEASTKEIEEEGLDETTTNGIF